VNDGSGGMPIGAPVNKTAKPGVYTVDFPVKPGDTRRRHLHGALHRGRALPEQGDTKDENTYLIVPNGVALKV
jgi:hypothetical protein